VPVYRVQRLFLHASALAFGLALAFVIVFLIDGDVRDASISAGIAFACFSYWMAFHESRDLKRKS
jgi:hypothetical protein